MVFTPQISTLRQLISELRKAIPKNNFKDSLLVKYIFQQYRKYQTTDEQLCKAREEVKFIANTYLTYLRSSRMHKEILDEFHGKGERTVEQTAKMVGFKLPHEPK